MSKFPNEKVLIDFIIDLKNSPLEIEQIILDEYSDIIVDEINDLQSRYPNLKVEEPLDREIRTVIHLAIDFIRSSSAAKSLGMERILRLSVKKKYKPAIANSISDQEIVDLIKKNEPNTKSQAMDFLMVKYVPRWNQAIIRMDAKTGYNLKVYEVEDFVQEGIYTFLNNVRLNKYKEQGYLFSYIKDIIWKKVMNEVNRREKPQQDYKDWRGRNNVTRKSNDTLPDRITEDKQHLDLVYECMRKGTPKCYELLYKKYIEQLGNKEIAKELGISPGYVGIRLHKCKKSLLSCLSEKNISIN